MPAPPPPEPAPPRAPTPPPQQQPQRPRVDAFEPEVVLDNFPRRIDSLCLWGDTLLIGVGDGGLLFLEERAPPAPTPPATADTDAAEPQPRASTTSSSSSSSSGGGASDPRRAPLPRAIWEVTRVEKGFCRRAVPQLLVVPLPPQPTGATPAAASGGEDAAATPAPPPPTALLISLCSEHGVRLHALPSLAPLAVVPRTAAAATAAATASGQQQQRPSSATLQAQATCFAYDPTRRWLAVATARKKVVAYALDLAALAAAAATANAAWGPGGTAEAATEGPTTTSQPPLPAQSALREVVEYAIPAAAPAAVMAWVSGNLVLGTPGGGGGGGASEGGGRGRGGGGSGASAAAGEGCYWLIAPGKPRSVEVLPGQALDVYAAVAPVRLLSLAPSSSSGGAAAAASERAAPPVIAAVPPPAGGVSVLSSSSTASIAPSTDPSTTTTTPAATAPASELLVSDREGRCLFVGPDGRRARAGHLCWTDRPVALAASDLYCVALLPHCVEVRAISRALLGGGGGGGGGGDDAGSGDANTTNTNNSPAFSGPAAQTLLLPGMATVAPAPSRDGSLFVATGAGEAGAAGGVRRLRPVPLERQALGLADAGDFSAALDLLARLQSSEAAEDARAEAACRARVARAEQAMAASVAAGASAKERRAAAAAIAAADAATEAAHRSAARRRRDRRALEDGLRVRCGHALFAAGEHEEALAQLSLCGDPSPLLLLRLFPSLVAPKHLPWLPESAHGEALPPLAAAAAAVPAKPHSSSSSSLSGRGGGGADKGEQHANGSEGASSAAAAAAAVVIPYLLSHRTRLQAALARLQEEARREAEASGVAAAAEDDDNDDNEQEPLPSDPAPPPPAYPPRTPAQARQLLSVVDTALVRALLLQPADTGALLRLLQSRASRPDPDDSAAALAAAGRYAELVALYQRCGRHAEGLDLLRRLSEGGDGGGSGDGAGGGGGLPVPPTGAAADLPGLPGVWAAVRYLVTCKPPREVKGDVLRRHAGWILRADPDAGVEALVSMSPPPPPALALALLEEERAPAPARARYLERALAAGVASPAEFHGELLGLYLRACLADERRAAAVAAAAAARRRRQPQKEQEGGGGGSGGGVATGTAARPPPPPQPALQLFPDDRRLWGIAPFSRLPATTTATTPPPSATQPPPPPSSSSADALASSSDAAVAAAGWEGAGTYERLRQLAYASPYVDPAAVLALLPGPRALPEIRALMLERQGRHAEALALYTRGLGDLDAAEAYCDRVYAAAKAAAAAAGQGGGGGGAGGALLPPPTMTGAGGLLPPVGGGGAAGAGGVAGLPAGASPGHIYTVLLDAAIAGVQPQQQQQHGGGDADEPAVVENGDASRLAPPPADGPLPLSSPLWRDLALLLARKRDRVDPRALLDRLPQNLPVSAAEPLLAALLEHGCEARRNLSVVRALRRAEDLDARVGAGLARSRCVLLTPERACCLCHRRLGGPVVVAYPPPAATTAAGAGGGAMAGVAAALRARKAAAAAAGGGGAGAAAAVSGWDAPTPVAHYICYKRSLQAQQQQQERQAAASSGGGAGSGGGGGGSGGGSGSGGGNGGDLLVVPPPPPPAVSWDDVWVGGRDGTE